MSIISRCLPHGQLRLVSQRGAKLLAGSRASHIPGLLLYSLIAVLIDTSEISRYPFASSLFVSLHNRREYNLALFFSTLSVSLHNRCEYDLVLFSSSRCLLLNVISHVYLFLCSRSIPGSRHQHEISNLSLSPSTTDAIIISRCSPHRGVSS